MIKAKVLVTGGPGFIGRRVVQRFLDNGYEVVSFSLPGECAPVEWGKQVEMRYGDVTVPEDCVEAANGCGLVVHLAALVGHAGDYALQWSVIADGTRHICAAAAAQQARLVVASSIAVYGEKIQTEICHERVGHGPWAGAYGRAKQGQETIALELAKRHDLDLTLIRPANVYGLGGSSAWGEKLIAGLKSSGGAMIGDAENNDAGLVYVENLADAIYLAATHHTAVGQTYNVCDENEVSWARFMSDMAALAGCAPSPIFPLDAVLELVRANEVPADCVPPSDPNLPYMEGINLVGYSNRFPSDRIRRDLGWQPSIDYNSAMTLMRSQLGL